MSRQKHKLLIAFFVVCGMIVQFQPATAGVLVKEGASACEIRTVMTEVRQAECPEVYQQIKRTRALTPATQLPGAPPPPPVTISSALSLYPASVSDKVTVMFGEIPGLAREFMITFQINSADLTPTAREMLATIGEVMKTDMRSSLYSIIGSTDITGARSYNMQLSRERAIAVTRYLVDVAGIDPRRLQFDGIGPDRPIDPAHPEDPMNRRVTFYVHVPPPPPVK